MTDNNNLTVSVVIPCYNGSAFIGETLDSCLAQTHPPLEIIVVDDGSTDDSAEIAESYGHPVRVIRQPNQGESVARNSGIDAAQGEWIGLLDADDLWEPEKLEKQIAVIEPDIVAVHTNLYYFGDMTGETRIQDMPPEQRYSVAQLAQGNTFGNPSSLIFRRASAPRFPSWTIYAEDLIFSIELVRQGKIVLVEEALTGYRRHANCQSKQTKAVILNWLETIETWMEQQGDEISEDFKRETRDCWLPRIVRLARRLKNKREWSEYHRVCKFLESYRGNAEVDQLLQSTTYPRWMYAGTDATKTLVKSVIYHPVFGGPKKS